MCSESTDRDGSADCTLQEFRDLIESDEDIVDVVLDLISHPLRLPSLVELATVNPIKSEDGTLEEMLDELMSLGIVKLVGVPDDFPPDGPQEFYTLTEIGWEYVDESLDVFDMMTRSILQTAWRELSFSEEADAAFEAPRPGYDYELEK